MAYRQRVRGLTCSKDITSLMERVVCHIVPSVGSDVHKLEHLIVKEELLVERAKQLLDKEEALMSLERQLRVKQEALYWRERCLRSEQLTVTTTPTPTTPTCPAPTINMASMPPLMQIQPTVVGLEPRATVGRERLRVTLMHQPHTQLLLQQPTAGRLAKQQVRHSGSL